MTNERAIEILDPEHREHYESIEPVNEACRIGMNAIKRVHELEKENKDLQAKLLWNWDAETLCNKIQPRNTTVMAGTKFFRITDKLEIEKVYIVKTHFAQDEIIFTTTNTKGYKPCESNSMGAKVWNAIKNQIGLAGVFDFGRTAFWSRKAAKKRLRELKGEDK